ncbi:MAG TPA: BatD family protein [Ignavibacteriaceae bacterium]|jgi:hypothetical protein|nr:BatD family protein [Ignavibacteriaceae bacterium]
MKVLLNISLIFISSLSLLAQSFTASVSSTKIGKDDRLEVSFTFQGEDINSVTGFQPPSFSDFLVMSGPNQSQSMQIINGVVSGSRSFTYYVQARSIGKFTIGTASINFKGSTLKTQPISIEVVAGSSRPQQQQRDAAISNQEIAENLFIRAFIDKNTVYKGEQVTVTYKLYTRLNISSPQITKLPSYQGFWAEEIESPGNIGFTRENYDGKVFNVATLKRAALFPTETGELTVTPFELKIPVAIQRRSRSNNLFDDFFNDPFFGRTETVEYTARSNGAKVKVLPLPQTTIPSFNGAVGNFNFNANIDRESVKQNEPISLKIEINGTGNLKLVQIPEIKLPPGFEKYEPKVNENMNRGSTVGGTKKIEILLIPRNHGKFTIQPVEFTYFNPAKKDYVTLSSNAFNIEVEKGSAEYTSISSSSKEEIKLLGSDIRFIKTSTGGIREKGEYFVNSLLFWLLTILPTVATLVFVVYRRKEDKLRGNVRLMRNLRAEKIAKSRLKTAAKFLKENAKENFYTEISQALLGYIEDKLNIPKADLTMDNAVAQLHYRGIDENLIPVITETIEKCEFIRFSPGNKGIEEMNEIYKQASSIIIELEEQLAIGVKK